MQLNDLLSEIYLDGEIPIDLLKKYGLESVLDSVVQRVSVVLESSTVSNGRLIGLAPTVVVLINGNLKEIPIGQDRNELVYLAAEVANYLFKKLIGKSEQPVVAIEGIKQSLEDACKMNNYNLDDLVERIRYKEMENEYPSDLIIVGEIFWYEWRGRKNLLNKMAHKLRRQNHIRSVREFKLLFKQHNNPKLRVEFQAGSAPFMLALFDELKDVELIVPKGCSGHFHPLYKYGVDFEGNIWMKIEPKSVKGIAKRDKEKWQKLKNLAKMIVLELKPTVTSELPLDNVGKITRAFL